MTFIKEVLANYSTTEFGNFESCNLYKIYDKENIVGQFVVADKVAFFSTTEFKYRIDITNHFFKASTFEIIDTETEIKIGFYKLNWNFGWKDIGTLVLNDMTYTCKRQRPDIRSNIFKKSTWGHCKLTLSNNQTEIIYKIKVETRWLEGANSEFRNAKGEINFTQADTTEILSGLLFIERALHIDDSNSL